MIRVAGLIFVSIVLSFGLNGCSTASAPDRTAITQHLFGNPDVSALCYSGHRKDARTVENTPSIEETKEDLRILSAMGVKLIRTYNTTLFPHSERILQSIRELNQADPEFEMAVMLGAWIQCKGAYTEQPNHRIEDTDGNRREIEAAIRLARKYPDIVKIIAVGNESMVTWQAHFVPAQVILKWVNILQEARSKGQIPESILITTSDNWAALGGEEQYRNNDLVELLKRIDFLSLHTYAFHDTYYNPALQWGPLPEESKLRPAEQIAESIKRAIELQNNQVQAVKDYLALIDVDKAIHIGETGWASKDNAHYGDDGTRAAYEYTAGLFYEACKKWTRKNKMSCFYFEAFDEPWKSDGTAGSEGHFGLFTVDGKAKYAIWNLVDKGLFDGLSRGGKPITKTHKGDEAALMQELKAPKHVKY